MASLNSVHLIGNAGKDPDTKFTQGGMAITRISLATTDSRKDKDGNRTETTDWHNLVFFGKLAEVAGEYLKKGSQFSVQGRIKYGKYDDKEGVTRYTTDINVDSLQLLGKKEGGQQAERPQRQAPAQQQVPADQFNDDDFKDDIPF